MADLEKHAIRRDRSFLVRLVAILGAALIVGAIAIARYGDSEFGSCAATRFGDLTEPAQGSSP